MNESLDPGKLSDNRPRIPTQTGPREYDTEIQLLGRIASAVDGKMPVSVTLAEDGTAAAAADPDLLYSVAAVEGDVVVAFHPELSMDPWTIAEGVVIEFIDGAKILSITPANPGRCQVCAY